MKSRTVRSYGMNRRVVLSTRVTPQFFRRVGEAADKAKRSISDWVRETIEKRLQGESHGSDSD